MFVFILVPLSILICCDTQERKNAESSHHLQLQPAVGLTFVSFLQMTPENESQMGKKRFVKARVAMMLYCFGCGP